jgi:hypothetical protein
VPDAAAFASAQQIIKEVFKDQFADTSTSGQIALSKQLLAEAAEPQKVPGSEYALLIDAGAAAMKAGDIAQALLVARLLSGRFELDTPAVILEAITGASRAATTAQAATLAAQVDLRVAKELASDGDWPLAGAAAALAASCATHADPALPGDVPAVAAQIQAAASAYQAALPAIQTSVTHPADPPANLAAGRFYCLSLEQWDHGLTLLAKGSDPALKDLAQRELSASNDASQKLAVADAWLAAPMTDAASREAVIRHAGFLYSQALPALNGLRQLAAQKRLIQFRTAHLEPGLVAEIFNTSELLYRLTTRIDPQIDFDWKGKSPGPGLPAEYFSGRWTGWLRTRAAGFHRFKLVHDDGARLWIDGRLIIDNWKSGGATDQFAANLDAGLHALRLEFNQLTAKSWLRLHWTPPGSAEPVPIPPDALFHEPLALSPQLPSRLTADSQGVVHLDAAHAEVHGRSLHFFEKNHPPHLGSWRDLTDTASWTSNLPGGTYRVSLTYACDPKNAGGTFVVIAGPRRFTARADSTGNWATVQTFPLGTIKLPPGETFVSVVPRQIVRKALLDFVEVTLTPVPAN